MMDRSRLIALAAVLLAGCTQRAVPTIGATAIASTTPIPSASPTTQATAQPVTPSALRGGSVELAGHTAPVTRVAWSPDRKLIATTAGDWQSPDPTIRLWRADGTLVRVLAGHTEPVMSLAWSRDGKLLASGSLDKTIRIWRADGTLVRTIDSPVEVVSLAWSPDGQVLVSGSASVLNPLVSWWRADGTPLFSRSTQFTGGKFYNLLWAPDGRYLLGGAVDYKVWAADGTEVFHLESCAHCTPAWGAAWSPDGTRWAVGNESGEISVFDVQGKQLAQMRDNAGNVDVLAWSPSGRRLAGGDGVQMWSADGTLVAGHGSSGRVTALAWSADGKRLAAVSDDGGLQVWSADDALLDLMPGSFAGVAWTQGGVLLAAQSVGNDVKLWRLEP